MLNLPEHELIIFAASAAAYLAAAVVGILQLRAGDKRCSPFLAPLATIAAILQTILLISRAAAIKAVPLTETFESLVVLTITFTLIYLFLSMHIRHIWFGSIMVWVICSLNLLAATVAQPPSAANEFASTPWAIAHAVAMILGGAALMLATTTATLYLFATRKLKQKEVTAILGKVPNIEKLEQINLLGLKSCFVLMTFGLATGAALAISQKMTALDLLTDSKIVLVTTVWLLVGLVLLLWRTVKLKKKTIAHVTIIASALILFAAVGTLLFCGTWHVF